MIKTIINRNDSHWDNSKLLKEVDELFKIEEYGFLVSDEFKSHNKVVIITKIESNPIFSGYGYFVSICHDIIDAYKFNFDDSNCWYSFYYLKENFSKQYCIDVFKIGLEKKKFKLFFSGKNLD